MGNSEFVAGALNQRAAYDLLVAAQGLEKAVVEQAVDLARDAAAQSVQHRVELGRQEGW